MALLRASFGSELTLRLEGKKIYLRVPHHNDYGQWRDLRGVSQDFLRYWEPSWAEDELSRHSYRRRLRFYQKEIQNSNGYSFFIFCQKSDRLLGGLTVSNIRRGVTQSATLGYWIGEPFAGKGLMTKAVKMVSDFCFDQLRLHRVEAACLQDNEASARVLEKCGYTKEGIARRYLKINGQWQDHILYARLEDDPYC